MSQAHDAGQFLPEEGDRVAIAGDFNDWQRDGLFLSDADGDWIYTLPLDSLMEPYGLTLADTVAFQFVHHAGDGRSLSNHGREALAQRRLSLATVVDEAPLFAFDEPLKAWDEAEVRFVVGMENQQVLGFFRPDEGDRVVVSGSFCGWCEEGVELEDPDEDGVYSVTAPVRYEEGQPIQYRFRIMTNRDGFLPNKGWEARPPRSLVVEDDVAEAQYAAFSDLRRVMRFVVDTEAWQQNGRFRPSAGDILQIKIMFDGNTHLTEPLVEVEAGRYEMAAQVPLVVEQVGWQIVRNIDEALSEPRAEVVPLTGTLVTYTATSAETVAAR